MKLNAEQIEAEQAEANKKMTDFINSLSGKHKEDLVLIRKVVGELSEQGIKFILIPHLVDPDGSKYTLMYSEFGEKLSKEDGTFNDKYLEEQSSLYTVVLRCLVWHIVQSYGKILSIEDDRDLRNKIIDTILSKIREL